jgi:pyrroline-5-carboxylate reductase
VRAVLVLNERIGEIVTEAEAVRTSKPFKTSDAAAILRRLNATVTSARELAGSLEREPRTAIVGSGLQTFYLGLKALSDEALKSSLSNADAYKSALAEIPTRMSRLAALDEELKSLLD